MEKLTLEEMEYNLLAILYAKTVKWVELVGVLEASDIVGNTISIFHETLTNPPSKEICDRLEAFLSNNAKIAKVPEYQFDEIDWDMMKMIASQRKNVREVLELDPTARYLYELRRKRDNDFESLYAKALLGIDTRNRDISAHINCGKGVDKSAIGENQTSGV